MPSEIPWVWLVLGSLGGLVVLLDFLREPRDWRWVLSLAALIGLGIVARDSFREPDLRFVLLTGLAVSVLVAWAASRSLARHRQARIVAWARDRGYEPVAVGRQRAEATLPEPLRRLPVFKTGAYSRTEGLLRRDDPAIGEVLVYRFSTLRNASWYGSPGVETSGTVVALRRPGSPLPFFQIRPQGLFPWFDGGSVGDPVATTPGSRFTESYRLSGHEPRNLRALLSDDLLDAIAEKPGWIVQGEGEWVAALYFDRSENLMSLKTSSLRTVDLHSLDAFTREAARLAGRVAEGASRTMARGVGAA